MSTKPLSGNVAVVTGAGRGIGRACAERLAQEGASVVLAARSSDELEEVSAAIEEAGGRAEVVVTDVTDRSEVRRLIDRTEEMLWSAGHPGKQCRRDAASGSGWRARC